MFKIGKISPFMISADGTSQRLLLALINIAARIQHRQIQVPKDTARRLERDARREGHVPEVDNLRERPHLPVCAQSVRVEVPVLTRDVRRVLTLHRAHGADEESETERRHEELVGGDALSDSEA